MHSVLKFMTNPPAPAKSGLAPVIWHIIGFTTAPSAQPVVSFPVASRETMELSIYPQVRSIWLIGNSLWRGKKKGRIEHHFTFRTNFVSRKFSFRRQISTIRRELLLLVDLGLGNTSLSCKTLNMISSRQSSSTSIISSIFEYS